MMSLNSNSLVPLMDTVSQFGPCYPRLNYLLRHQTIFILVAHFNIWKLFQIMFTPMFQDTSFILNISLMWISNKLYQFHNSLFFQANILILYFFYEICLVNKISILCEMDVRVHVYLSCIKIILPFNCPVGARLE